MIAFDGNVRPTPDRLLSICRRRSVRLTYGIHDFQAEVAGLTVAEAEIAFGDILNLDPAAQGFINGHQVEGGTILWGADRLEWVRERGRKGSDRSEVLVMLDRIASSLERIANKLDPPPNDIVGTPYLAQKLGCTTTYISLLIRTGKIPLSCIVAGTGNGRMWKFHRQRIDTWIQDRS